MNTPLSDMIDYLKDEEFIKVENINEFPELGEEEKSMLQNFGLPTDRWGSVPCIISDGKLKKYGEGLIELGLSRVGCKYLLDTKSKQILFNPKDESELIPVNSSLRQLLACRYAKRKYYHEVEGEEKFGPYHQNPKKYAEALRAMLMEADPGIKTYAFWQEILLEKELGVH
jgi:hypothetical protein